MLGFPQLLAITTNLDNFTAGAFTLHPIVVLEAMLSITPTDAGASAYLVVSPVGKVAQAGL